MPDPAMLMDAVVGAGNLADLPGSVFRDLKYGKSIPESVDQFATPLSSENRTTGRDLIRDYGWTDKKDIYTLDDVDLLEPTWKNFAGGLAAEMALDPWTYTGIGAGWRPAHRLAKAALANRAMRASVPVSKKVPRGFTTEVPEGLMERIIRQGQEPLASKDSMFLHTTANSPSVRRQGLKSRSQLGDTSGSLGGGPESRVSVTYDAGRSAAIERALSAQSRLLRGEITPSEAARGYGGGGFMSAPEPRGDLLWRALMRKSGSSVWGSTGPVEFASVKGGPRGGRLGIAWARRSPAEKELIERDWDQFSKFLDDSIVADLDKKRFVDILDLTDAVRSPKPYHANVMALPADLARINPRNIKTLPIAIRKTALDDPYKALRERRKPGYVWEPSEEELQLSPEDLHVLADPLLNLIRLPAGQFKGAGSAGAAALGARFGGNQ